MALIVTIDTEPRARVNPAQWDDWMARCGAEGYQHFAAYGALMERTGAAASYMRFSMDGRDVARAIMMTQRLGPLQVMHLPRGIVFAAPARMPAVFAKLRSLACGWKGRFVLLSPPDAAQAAAIGAPVVMTGESEALLEICSDRTTQQAQMHQKWRNRLFKAERSDLQIRRVRSDHPLAQWLMKAETQQRKERGYKALPASLPATMEREKGRTDSLFCIAMQGDVPVSGASFVVCGGRAAYFSGVTTPQGRDVCAQHLALSHSVQLLRERKVISLNLGLVDTQKNQGLSRFKLGSGAHIITRPGLFVLR